jgi:membrane-associated phospholipid phosphatase
MTRRTKTALACAAAAAAAFAVVRVLAYAHPFHHADALVLHDFLQLDRPRSYRWLTGVAHTADPGPYGLLGLLLIAIALRRGRVRVAAAVVMILGGAAVTTDKILKPALAEPRFDAVLTFHQIPPTGFPSGHATASMALALCAVLVAAPRFRPYVAALGALFAVAVCYSFLALGWHYPSDVLGGYLVAGFWTALAVAALSAADARWPARTGREAAGRLLSRVQARALTAALAAMVLVAVVLVAVIAPDRALDFVRGHTLFTVGAAAIALASVAVSGVVAAILRD